MKTILVTGTAGKDLTPLAAGSPQSTVDSPQQKKQGLLCLPWTVDSGPWTGFRGPWTVDRGLIL